VYDQDTSSGKILGIAWSYTHLVIFKQTIESLCGNATVVPTLREELCAAAERSIWTHETGHLFGLVDNGLPMVAPHRDADPSHGAHDANNQCVMYWSYEGQDLITLLVGRLGSPDPALGFDQQCQDDVAAVRNR
jgi:hypothetical protein